MKKTILIIASCFFVASAYAADSDLPGLGADATPTSDDIGYTVNDPGGAGEADKKVLLSNWLAGKVIITDNESTAENNPICFVAGGDLDGDTTNGLGLETDGDCYYTPSTGVITCPGFAGAVTGAVTGNASTASALAANGANCAAGSYPLGVDAAGAVESCTDATTEIDSAITTHTSGEDHSTTTAGDHLTRTGDDFDLDAEVTTKEKAFVFVEPDGTTDFFLPKQAVAITITNLDCITTTGTAIFHIKECDSAGQNCADNGMDVTCNVPGSVGTDTPTDGAIDANDWMFVVSGTVSSPGPATLTLKYTIDD